MFTVGSVCSGIEAASVAWKELEMNFSWFSEIAVFPSKILSYRYPSIQNIGDMNNIPNNLLSNLIHAPDIICGGTPCQAFSLTGQRNGLNDDRGNLTLKFVDIIDANDFVRLSKNKSRTIVFWENVEGVLTDKTNAFGCLVSSLAGLDNIIQRKKWPNAGIIKGVKRNVAWRVLDAKYFGLPQQRKRLYLLAGDKNFNPDKILFEIHTKESSNYPKTSLSFEKEGHTFKVFREYTDCLYSAYGTKWNGNAAAYNGSLFILQDDKLRRLSPLECERLMGFPDNYTDIPKAKKTLRYQAIGNSWAVPVVKWIGERIIKYINENVSYLSSNQLSLFPYMNLLEKNAVFFDFGKNTLINIDNKLILNCSSKPENICFSNIKDIVSSNVPNDIYLSSVGCHGILRRKNERNLKMNPELEKILINISSKMCFEDIEKKSRQQKRGKFS